MKKYFVYVGIILLSFSLCLFGYLGVNISFDIRRNRNVVDTFNNIFKNSMLFSNSFNEFGLPIIEIDDVDYVGIIDVDKHGLSLAVKNKCSDIFVDVSANCKYFGDNFIIFGTNLNNSFSDYWLYNVGDSIRFTNALGSTFLYKIKKIKRVDGIDDVYKYSEDLIIVIRDYYDLEYVLLLCEVY